MDEIYSRSPNLVSGQYLPTKEREKAHGTCILPIWFLAKQTTPCIDDSGVNVKTDFLGSLGSVFMTGSGRLTGFSLLFDFLPLELGEYTWVLGPGCSRGVSGSKVQVKAMSGGSATTLHVREIEEFRITTICLRGFPAQYGASKEKVRFRFSRRIR